MTKGIKTLALLVVEVVSVAVAGLLVCLAISLPVVLLVQFFSWITGLDFDTLMLWKISITLAAASFAVLIMAHLDIDWPLEHLLKGK